MIEAIAPAMAIDALGDVIRGARIILLVDSEAAEGALIRGYSGTEDLCALTGIFWRLCVSRVSRAIAPYIDRVPTDGNPSDGPSRGRSGELLARGAVRIAPREVSRVLATWSGHWGSRSRSEKE